MIFTRRTRRLGAVALGATIVGGAAAAMLAATPGGAAGIISAVTTVSCSGGTPAAVYALNTVSYGADVEGSNIGLVGRAPTPAIRR